jgi:hypothetical protein
MPELYEGSHDEPVFKPIEYTRAGTPPRECFECGGYGFHFDYCDKVL